MNEINVLRRINSQIKYSSIPEYIGLEIPLRIVDEAEVLGEIQNLIQRHLSTNIIAVEQHYVMGTIAKYGMIDLTFEVDGEILYNPVGGIQILKDNGWIDKEGTDEFKKEGFGFLKDMLKEAEETAVSLLAVLFKLDLKK